ncbi:FAD-binding oxidoreductase [Phenylobacterium sp.]|uniref:NAD(P)/FAD-dependent oxidoreductase n=1 Tax=Phenylobacterium sp. TaxID=1871053 RepID=UPI0027359EEC|nr:FAD-dependent oxidoreductase [Phenylobacterium sp.]MDP3659353.1 FAD-dependent oxidoreductase [Phenylobacterium sp.]
MHRTRKVVVAGAGALGLTSALALARAGCDVSVLDPAAWGENASGVAAGMLAPAFEAALDPLSRPHFALLRDARDLWTSLAREIGLEIDRTPALAVGDDAWLAGLRAAFAAIGAPLADTAAGVQSPDDWRIEANYALDALRAAAQAHGVRFMRGKAARTQDTDFLVIATGAAHELATLAPELNRLQPIKGHILHYPGGLDTVIRTADAYAAPSARGRLVGASMETGRDDLDVDPTQVAILHAAAQRLFRDVADLEPQVRVGVRAGAPDGLPLVGPAATPGVLIAAGARRNGWLLAPLVARMIAAYAMGDDPGPHAATLHPKRFEAATGIA